MNPKYGEIARPPQAYVAPQFTRHRFSRRNAAAIASIGSPQIKIAIGLANELAATKAARTKAMDAVDADEPSAIPMFPARPSALRASRLPCSCGSTASASTAVAFAEVSSMPGSS
jgi:hypothetical protein